MLSTYQKVIKLSGMLGTDDLNPWETEFVSSMKIKADGAAQSGQVVALSDNQLEKIEQIHKKHFA